MASRADAPGGLGYALENRLVVSQTFPDAFGDMRVARLASFFNAYRENILGLATSRRDRAVLLTPGPYNESYFEHVYLAHYLGLTLVEGDDLVVRDGAGLPEDPDRAGAGRGHLPPRRFGFLRSAGISRRQRAGRARPGRSGARRRRGAGQCAGRRRDRIARRMDAYLPALAQALLGEELKIPDIATIWCGTEWGRKEALARLATGMLRDAFDARPLFSRNSTARLGADMSAEERASAVARIDRRGETLVVQDIAPLGLAPVFEGGSFRRAAGLACASSRPGRPTAGW